MPHPGPVRFVQICLLAVAAWSARGGVVYSLPDVGGAVVQKNGSRVVSGTGRLGAQSSPFAAIGGRRCVVYVFQLPALPGGADGASPLVLDASLQFTIVADQPDGAYNIDLYGLAARPLPAVLATDGFAGPLDITATTIQDNMLSGVHPDTGVENVLTSPSANVSLAEFLNAQYGPLGAGAGQYVFLRLNPDVDPPNEDSGMDVAFGRNPTGGPVLTITLAPEPGMACAAVASLALTRRRRRATLPTAGRFLPHDVRTA
jgi:hypothetical protein